MKEKAVAMYLNNYTLPECSCVNIPLMRVKTGQSLRIIRTEKSSYSMVVTHHMGVFWGGGFMCVG